MLIMAVVLMGTSIVSSAVGNVVTLFEDTEPLVGRLAGTDSVVVAERVDVYYGSTAIKVATPMMGIEGQVCNRCISGWKYKVVKKPTKGDEFRWVMFAWKKPDGDGIMVQLAKTCGWGYNIPRYVAGKNLPGWPAIGVNNQAPRGWQVVIRDLYSDFGKFTLTGIALTPFSGVGLFDSIYLAKSRDELLSVFEPAIDTGVFVSVPSKVDDSAYFTAAIRVQDIYDLAGFEMEVRFDPNIIKVDEVKEGTFLASGGSTYWMPPDDDNRKGRITTIMCIRTGSSGCSGSGVLLTITFRARSKGSSYIVLENVRLADSLAKWIPIKVTNANVEVADVPPWDVNRDGRVDALDLVIVAQRFGEYISQPGEVNPDVNGDRKVDIADLIAVGKHYGDTYGDGAPSKLAYSVPLQLVPSLVKALGLVRSSPHPDKSTICLLMGLIKNAMPVGTTTWGRSKLGPR